MKPRARVLGIVALAMLAGVVSAPGAPAGDAGNRLTYLDGDDPYHVGRDFPRLTTPQWLGEEGVDAVVILSIDDLRDIGHYEGYLRPILERLKKIDGRAPVSIMTCAADAKHPQIQSWLAEGLSIEVHTVDHPCPILQNGDFARAKSTYDRCLDQLDGIDGVEPVAFRTPCCDSRNTPSPRFYSEIFNGTTPTGRFLWIDSSVFNLPTADDPEVPPSILRDEEGRERFRKYVPFTSFVNTVENYPYPWIIGKRCLQFPCATPSDWQAQNLHGNNNPLTLRDMKAAVDLHVIKKGAYSLVFHPHGWLRNSQVVELIDHAVARYGKRVKFLSFADAAESVEAHLLAGQSLRAPGGDWNGVLFADVDNDGFMDVLIGNDDLQRTRRWSAETSRWIDGELPVRIVRSGDDGRRIETGVRFGVLHADARASFIVRNEHESGGWHFDGSRWKSDPTLLAGLEIDGEPVFTARDGVDRGVRLRDLDADGTCELLVSRPGRSAIFRRDASLSRWVRLPVSLPAGTSIVDEKGWDAGLRFADVDIDGRDDVVFSAEERYSLDLFDSLETGWSRSVLAGSRKNETAANALPAFVDDGAGRGAFFHSRHLWLQNEDTAGLPDLVDRRSFAGLLADVDPQPKSPAASRAAIKTLPGFVVELMAAEPLVRDPVAFDWGVDGKLWVVEMSDYPVGMDGKGKPGGRVVYLEDSDDDGQYDRSTLFLEGLPFPTGVRTWGRGVLVTSAPDIIYAEDSDGDGRADRRETLYTGFGLGNQQHRVNTLVWGLDNWIHCANGDSNGTIRSTRTDKAVDIRGRDFRISPDDGGLDTVTGQTQFSTTRDDWGNWFGCSNPNPMFHFVLEDRYLRRNPHLKPPSPRRHVAPPAGRVYPRSRTLPRVNDQHMANRFTSACGLTFYRDDLFGAGFNGNAFVSEPVHNLVRRIILEPQGVTFGSRHPFGEETREFLASSDNWFRPTSVRVGPDGALWIADMYRGVIEHPQYFYEGNFKKLDVRGGDDLGRIWRVYPARAKLRRLPPYAGLTVKDLGGLTKALESPNGWVRDMAHQILVRGKPGGAARELLSLVHRTKSPQAKVHALSAALALHGPSDVPSLVRAIRRLLSDEHPGVRRRAVRASERFLSFPALSSLLDPVLALGDDPDPLVRLQVAYSLGEINRKQVVDRIGTRLAEMALQHARDPYLRAAIFSSATKVAEPMLLALLQRYGKKGSDDDRVLRLVEALFPVLVGTSPDALSRVFLRITNGLRAESEETVGELDTIAALLDASRRAGKPLTSTSNDPAVSRTLGTVLDRARRTAVDESAAEGTRLASIRLLGRSAEARPADERDAIDADLAALAALLVPRTPQPVQEAAVDGISAFPGDAPASKLIDGWASHSPGLRARILDNLLSRDTGVPTILAAIDNERIAPADIETTRRRRFLETRDAKIRARAEEVFGRVSNDRLAVIAGYAESKTRSGDVVRGRTIFDTRCAPCHQLGERGHPIGSDLRALVDKSADFLITAIFDPNRSVESKYTQYTAVTSDGKTFAGIIAEETGPSLTLLEQESKRHVVLRRDLVRLESTGKSMMPEGLEKDLSVQDVADLITVLQDQFPTPKTFNGNAPHEVASAADGSLDLGASTAEIYGKSLLFEAKYGNLGFWAGEDDRAAWRVTVPEAGSYEVELHWALPAGSPRNTLLVESRRGRLEHPVRSTGSWDTYKTTNIGRIDLAAGRQRLIVRSSGPVNGFLIDLRGLVLRPLR